MSHETRKKAMIGILLAAGAYFAVYFARSYFSGAADPAFDPATKMVWECLKCKSQTTLTVAEFDSLMANPEKVRYGVFRGPREPALKCEKCKTFSVGRVKK